MNRKLTWLGISAAAALFVMTGAASAIPLTLSGPIAGKHCRPAKHEQPMRHLCHSVPAARGVWFQ